MQQVANRHPYRCGAFLAAIGCINTRTIGSECGRARRLLTALSAMLVVTLWLGSNMYAQTCVTSISGTVYAPNGFDPVPNVLVYIPSGTVQPFTDGVNTTSPSLDSYAVLVSGSPLVLATTAANGTFTMTGVPVGSNVPLVIQAGRWRRQLTIPTVTACTSLSLATLNPTGDVFARFPRTQAEGDIPKIAVVTGGADGMECVLRKIGIADSEFTNYNVNASGLTTPGRVNFFRGGYDPGAVITSTSATPIEAQLVGSTHNSATYTPLVDNYNVVMLACQGYDGYTTASGRANLIDFTGSGGRVFATHYSYDYLYQDSSINGAAKWDVDQSYPENDPGAAIVNQAFSSGATLANWMQSIGIGTISNGVTSVSLSNLRVDTTGVVPPTQAWLTLENNSPNAVMQFSFNTPVGAAAASQYGKVMFNDYHVENGGGGGEIFPAECSAFGVVTTLTPQERLLEFSLFDLMNFQVPLVTPTLSQTFTNSPTSFAQGDSSDTITINIANGATAVSPSPLVSLTVTLPVGLTAVSMTDPTGIWNCNAGTLTCTLAAVSGIAVSEGTSIVLTVSVSGSAVVGSNSLTSTISSSGFANSVTGTDTLTILAVVPTTTTLVASPNPSVYGQSVTLAATVSPSPTGGTVNFYNGSTLLGTVAPTSGVATLSTSSLPEGTDSLTAVYSPGSTNFAASTSPVVTVNVSSAATTTAVTASTPTLLGTSVILTATVAPVAPGAGTPTGTVTFYDGSAQVGTPQPLTGSHATVSTSSLAVGSHTITAVYAPDNANYSGSASTALTEVVEDFKFTVGGNAATVLSATVLSGNTAVYTLQFTPSSGNTFDYPVVLTLTGLPSGSTYTISPPSISSGSGTTTLTVTVTTVKRQASAATPSRKDGNGFPRPLLLALCLPLLGSRKLRRQLRLHMKTQAVMMIMLAVLVVAGMTACGSGSGFYTQAPQTYPMTMTGTSGALHHSVTLDLTVQ